MRAKTAPPTSDQARPSDAVVADAAALVERVSPPADPDALVPASLLVSSRRGFLRGALAVAGGTAAAAALAACAPATGSAWSYAPLRSLTVAAGATAQAESPETEDAAVAAASTTEPITAGQTVAEPHPGWLDGARHGCP